MDGHLPQLAPDGKVQVGIEFRGGAPRRVHAITLVTAERNGTTTRPDELDEAIRLLVLGPAFDGLAVRPDDQTRIAINPEGPVLGGGPHLHAGLTGHKGAADGYGGFARESVSGLSGKDPARIDRVGAYAARYAAKNVVAAGLATHCEVLLSYTLGQASPVSVQVETFGTAKRTDDEIAARVLGTFDFRPAAIVRAFGLRDLPLQRREGFFTALAAYGQVGRDDLELPWERVDRVEALGS
jgi:S-adenosylmethionine synthetase